MKDEAVIQGALEVLRKGGVILYPTDTIWGLGCDATNEKAVARVYEIKKRCEAKALVVLAENLDMVARYVKEIPPIAIDLIEVNDVPMTIIYPEGQGLAPNVMAEDSSVGIRIPSHEFCQTLLHKFRKPLVSTSANISGEPSAKMLQDVSDEIRSAVDFVVPGRFAKDSTGKASQILKVGLRGEIEIIRK